MKWLLGLIFNCSIINAISITIKCEYTTPSETKTIQFTPDVSTEIPDLPYHLKCFHNTKLLLNTSQINLGKRSSLHLRNINLDSTSKQSNDDLLNFVPFHLTYTHFNPQKLTLRFPIKHEPVILESIVEKEASEDQGFLRKYWMYIVPFLVITFLTSGGSEEEEVVQDGNAPAIVGAKK